MPDGPDWPYLIYRIFRSDVWAWKHGPNLFMLIHVGLDKSFGEMTFTVGKALLRGCKMWPLLPLLQECVDICV